MTRINPFQASFHNNPTTNQFETDNTSNTSSFPPFKQPDSTNPSLRANTYQPFQQDQPFQRASSSNKDYSIDQTWQQTKRTHPYSRNNHHTDPYQTKNNLAQQMPQTNFFTFNSVESSGVWQLDLIRKSDEFVALSTAINGNNLCFLREQKKYSANSVAVNITANEAISLDHAFNRCANQAKQKPDQHKKSTINYFLIKIADGLDLIKDPEGYLLNFYRSLDFFILENKNIIHFDTLFRILRSTHKIGYPKIARETLETVTKIIQNPQYKTIAPKSIICSTLTITSIKSEYASHSEIATHCNFIFGKLINTASTRPWSSNDISSYLNHACQIGSTKLIDSAFNFANTVFDPNAADWNYPDTKKIVDSLQFSADIAGADPVREKLAIVISKIELLSLTLPLLAISHCTESTESLILLASCKQALKNIKTNSVFYKNNAVKYFADFLEYIFSPETQKLPKSSINKLRNLLTDEFEKLAQAQPRILPNINSVLQRYATHPGIKSFSDFIMARIKDITMAYQASLRAPKNALTENQAQMTHDNPEDSQKINSPLQVIPDSNRQATDSLKIVPNIVMNAISDIPTIDISGPDELQTRKKFEQAYAQYIELFLQNQNTKITFRVTYASASANAKQKILDMIEDVTLSRPITFNTMTDPDNGNALILEYGPL
ncbi:hypothetical protein [Paraburkholderia hayleyella]|uniref:hypothetical protein n=1 Tax=Paraburkholderia hayleyella TaxID=2152889 RepID=UPI00129163F0|nr:hypothetical protein [Paraburkholderia hayleyella]